jgi:hypothetical protein
LFAYRRAVPGRLWLGWPLLCNEVVRGSGPLASLPGQIIFPVRDGSSFMPVTQKVGHWRQSEPPANPTQRLERLQVRIVETITKWHWNAVVGLRTDGVGSHS